MPDMDSFPEPIQLDMEEESAGELAVEVSLSPAFPCNLLFDPKVPFEDWKNLTN